MTDHSTSEEHTTRRGKAYFVKAGPSKSQLKIDGDAGEAGDKFGTVFVAATLTLRRALSPGTLVGIALIISSVSSCNNPQGTTAPPHNEAEKE